MMLFSLLYFTAPDKQEAERIAHALVEARLVACVNVLPEITSVYRWEGVVQQGAEVAVLAKTMAEVAPRVVELVKSMHSYECPCILTLPITGGHAPFLQWVAAETKTS